MNILQQGYETAVRSKFGIDEDDLPNEELNNPLIIDVAEAIIKKRVPNYALINDPIELLFLQNAVISQICYMLCPSMAKRLNLKVSLSDVKLEKEKVDWVAQANIFAQEIEGYLDKIDSVDVVGVAGSGSLVNKIRNKRKPIGGGR